MARTEAKRKAVSVSAAAVLLVWMVFCLLVISDVVSAERVLKDKKPENFVHQEEMQQGFFMRVAHFLWQSGKSSYQHVWPVSIYIYIYLYIIIIQI